MCLCINKEKTRKLKQANPELCRIRYKKVSRRWYEDIFMGIYRSDYIYKIGKNQSDRKVGTRLLKKELASGNIHRGIHVYKNKPTDTMYRVIKVRCYAKDLVASGFREEVYTKIYIDSFEDQQ